MEERRNSSALAMELRLSYMNPLSHVIKATGDNCYLCIYYVDGFMQRRHNASPLAMELRLFALSHWYISMA